VRESDRSEETKKFSTRRSKLTHGTNDSSKSGLGNPDLGRFLLKQARDLVSLGDNP
jgi:hypothetical protein